MPRYKFGTGGGGTTPEDKDWTTVDLTDGSWTKTDPDSTASAISHSAGVNSATIDTTGQSDYVDGCVHYREITSVEDGSSMAYGDAPVHFRAAVCFPNTGWATSDGSSTGGSNNPPPGSRVYCLVGLTSDPSNFPNPADIAGAGLEWYTSTSRLYRALVRNTSTSSPLGNVGTNRTGLDNISESDVSAGNRAVNRVEFWFEIQPQENLSASGIDVAGSPKTDFLLWRGRYDQGDAYGSVNTYSLSQRWGRSANGTSKLYVWVAIGRTSGASSDQQLDFAVHYSIDGPLTSGTNPSGETPLS